jgi:hypothetical protein
MSPQLLHHYHLYHSIFPFATIGHPMKVACILITLKESFLMRFLVTQQFLFFIDIHKLDHNHSFFQTEIPFNSMVSSNSSI